jgi:hypothetical protein
MSGELMWVVGGAFVVGLGVGVWLLSQRRRGIGGLARRLRKRFGGRVVLGEAELLLEVKAGTVRIPMGRGVARALDPDDLLGEDHLMAEVARAVDWAEREDDEAVAFDELVPVIVAVERVEVVGDAAPFTLALSPEISIAFCAPGRGRETWLSIRQASALTSPASLLPLALENLRAASDDVPVFRYGNSESAFFLIQHGDGLDSSRILLHDLWNTIASRVDDDLVFATPSRDRLYAAPAHDHNALAALAQQSANDWNSRPFPVSPKLWTRSAKGIQPWTPHA